MERYKSTRREGDEIVKGTLLFLNLKLTEDQRPENYIAFLKYMNRGTKDTFIPLKGKKSIRLNMLREDNVIVDGYPRLLFGTIMTSDTPDPNEFYDIQKNEPADIEFKEGTVEHPRSVRFFFSPLAHRVAVFDSRKVSWKQVVKLFDEGGKRGLGEGALHVNTETDEDTIDRILNAKDISSFRARISYSNRDATKEFLELFDTNLREEKVADLKVTATPVRKGFMQPKPNGFLHAVIELARSNGFVWARLGGKKKEIINTDEHPMKEVFESTNSRLLGDIHYLLMRKFRPEKL
jgi:hypothetical protein